jgi:hypothetical protein
MYLGDFLKNAVVRFAWNASAANGASITRATNGTIHVYRDGNLTTEVTTGVTDTEDADSLPGLNVVAIDTSGAFYTVGSEFMVVLKSAVIDGQPVNAVLAHFSLERARVPVALGAKEFALLLTLLQARPQVLSKARLESALYGFDETLDSNAIEVHVHHLRRKLGESLIKTVRGVGYFIPREADISAPQLPPAP